MNILVNLTFHCNKMMGWVRGRRVSVLFARSGQRDACYRRLIQKTAKMIPFFSISSHTYTTAIMPSFLRSVKLVLKMTNFIEKLNPCFSVFDHRVLTVTCYRSYKQTGDIQNAKSMTNA